MIDIPPRKIDASSRKINNLSRRADKSTLPMVDPSGLPVSMKARNELGNLLGMLNPSYGSRLNSNMMNDDMHSIRNPLFDPVHNGSTQPSSWASLFKVSYMFDNLPAREDMTEKIDSIKKKFIR
ncbi:hypothetical protein Cni_G16962 [Canna indica]|uniref:Uncharacterized protein n=1 Tax=Canna indica TaxID=4628 RepID=A0AAQ3KIJ1_9LILI|nr:hypothetical protein Cni_G16962 [Canna indica]